MDTQVILDRPLSWFFNGDLKFIDSNYLNMNVDEDDGVDTRTDWRKLDYIGWVSAYLNDIEYTDIPEKPGIYVICHERQTPALYVGQSKNLKQRLIKGHHKIREILNLMRYDSREMLIYWKKVPDPEYSLDRTLIWCESIAVGLLCPVMQGNIEDIQEIESLYNMARGDMAYYD